MTWTSNKSPYRIEPFTKFAIIFLRLARTENIFISYNLRNSFYFKQSERFCWNHIKEEKKNYLTKRI